MTVKRITHFEEINLNLNVETVELEQNNECNGFLLPKNLETM